ncbi:hypothetical protein [Bdellovibrio sp. HCB209]|uniref:hypothetical protein n=1 Tax=Bdellovibrio sp. HCB209 TaxID=3394354 RepID=UPI0039B48476
MKKKVMLALAVIMVLGSVKAMASDSYYESREYIDNAISKSETSEENLAASLMNKIEGQILTLKSSGLPMDRVSNASESLSLGQAISKAELIADELRQNFDASKAQRLSIELDQEIASLISK